MIIFLELYASGMSNASKIYITILISMSERERVITIFIKRTSIIIVSLTKYILVIVSIYISFCKTHYIKSRALHIMILCSHFLFT